MLLIEADGKALFAAHGIPVPLSVVATDDTTAPAGAGPWVVKAQIPIGGRGKAGGIVHCASLNEVQAATARLLGTSLKGHRIDACLIEQAAIGQERYLSVMLDAAGYGLRVIWSATGGVEIELAGAARDRLCPPHPGAVSEALAELITDEPEAWRGRVADIGYKLAEMVMRRELALAEINPLFVAAEGCLAGDAKVVIDLNAAHRQPMIDALIRARPAIYADAHRKLVDGFDYVELDPDGEIGLIASGAGLAMLLLDELTARGAKPLNFCDIRTGQMRGSPMRLALVLEWITARRSLRAVLVNVFAGITDLAEFATLLATAIEATPGLTVPVVTRLVGRNAADAKRILAERQPDMMVTEDLEDALQRIAAITAKARS